MLGNTVAETLLWAINLAEESEQLAPSKLQSEGLGLSRTKVSSTPHTTSSSTTETINEDEREFLASILPVRVAAVSSDTYGSFPDLDDVSSESETYRNTVSRTGLGKAWSSDSSCVDASGALTYYLSCSRNPETKRLKEDRSRKTPGSHHRRVLRGDGTGPMETRTVPFSLAVDEIGSSAQVTVRTVCVNVIHSFDLHCAVQPLEYYCTLIFYCFHSQLPECLQASLYGLHTFHSYKTAVRANIMTGGDNVCRSWLIGECYCAAKLLRYCCTHVSLYHIIDRSYVGCRAG